MPEGDTIHKIAAYLGPELEGRRIVRLRLRAPAAAKLCTGQRIGQVTAQGKHLFIELENGLTLRTHLGLYGSWHRYREGEPWRKPRRQASVELATADAVFVCFNARQAELLEAASVRRRILDTRLGPDLARPPVDYAQVIRRSREFIAQDAPLIDLLLDQRVASGIGNVYKSEVLFLQGRHPQMPLAKLSDDDLTACYRTASGLLGRNLGGGPRRTRFENDGAGRLWVYGRAGLPCLRCSSRVSAARLGRDHRSTYWCPRCQGAAECGS